VTPRGSTQVMPWIVTRTARISPQARQRTTRPGPRVSWQGPSLRASPQQSKSNGVSVDDPLRDRRRATEVGADRAQGSRGDGDVSGRACGPARSQVLRRVAGPLARLSATKSAGVGSPADTGGSASGALAAVDVENLACDELGVFEIDHPRHFRRPGGLGVLQRDGGSWRICQYQSPRSWPNTELRRLTRFRRGRHAVAR
jgi:hypothetical protein